MRHKVKIDISIEIKLLFAVTEFKPDGFGSYTGHAVIIFFIQTTTHPALIQKQI